MASLASLRLAGAASILAVIACSPHLEIASSSGAGGAAGSVTSAQAAGGGGASREGGMSGSGGHGTSASGGGGATAPCVGTMIGARCLMTLATGLGSVGELVSDDTYLYWRTPSAAMRCAKTGCDGGPTIIADVEAGALAVNATDIFWLELPAQYQGSVKRCAKAGCVGAPVAVVGALNSPTAIAADDADVYLLDMGIGQGLLSCPSTGCDTPTKLASTDFDPTRIALDSSAIYWTNKAVEDGGSVMRCDKPACASGPVVLADGLLSPTDIALDATRVYWITGPDAGIWECPKTGPGGPTALSVAPLNQVGLIGLAADGTYVYTRREGDLTRCAVTGCSTPEVLVPGGGGNSIVVDDTSLYWADPDAGTIMKLTPK